MKKFLASFMGLFLLASGEAPALAQTASLLPNGEQVFVDANGVPYAGGKVYFYIPTTTTFKNTWQDPTESSLNLNPVILNGAGRAVIFGQGQYRQLLTDADGNTIWDRLTQDPTFAVGGTISPAMAPVTSAITLQAARTAMGVPGLTDNNTFLGTNSFAGTTSFTTLTASSATIPNINGVNLTTSSPVKTLTVETTSIIKPPTLTRIATTGAGTYTTPTGVTWLKIRMIGGGGGGGGSGGGGVGAGGAGGNTTFSTFTAGGGSGGSTSVAPNGGAGGTASGGTVNIAGGSGGAGQASTSGQNNTGGSGAGTPFNGGVGGSYVGNAGGSAIANTGAGAGGAAGNGGNAAGGGGGGAGGYIESWITGPASSYSYSVGAAGALGAAGASGLAGGTGAAGLILVEENYN